MKTKGGNYLHKKTKKGLLILFIILIFFTGHTYAIKGGIETAFKDIIYEVKAGDSLYKLALKFNTSIEKIKLDNNLSSDMIYVNQTLIIKGPSDSLYIVKAGDSLYKLALRFGTSIQEIKDINNLKSDMIYIGQGLKINKKTEEPSINYTSISGKVRISNKTKSNSSIQKQTIDTEMVSSLSINDFEEVDNYKKNEFIVKYKPMISSQAVEKIEKEKQLTTIKVLENNNGKIINYKISEDEDLETLLDYYKNLDYVEWAEPNYMYYPTAIPSDTYYNYHQWDYINMNLEAAWDLEKGDESVKVAILDTGIISSHPDLRNNLLNGADFVGGDNQYPVERYNMTDSDPEDETTLIKGGSHGTHVAGIIGAVTNNYRGIAGINWNVQILPVRVLKKTGGTSWDVVEGIYYALDQGADIINMSLGSPHMSYFQAEAISEAVKKGVTIIAAAGNEGASSVYYPAAYPDVIAVASTGKNNTRASYSNYGPEIDVSAPGGNYGESIYSTWGYYDDINKSSVSSYGGMIGTSMATPHVTGLAALLMANGIKDPEEIKSRIINTAIDLGLPGRDDYYGHGLIDAYGALLGKKIKMPQVFAAIKKGADFKVISDIVTTREDGIFVLNKVEKRNNILIIAWRDLNENGLIDKGDYFGKSEEIFNIAEYSINTLELLMNYLSSSLAIEVVK